MEDYIFYIILIVIAGLSSLFSKAKKAIEEEQKKQLAEQKKYSKESKPAKKIYNRCKICSFSNSIDSTFCMNCGHSLIKEQISSSITKKTEQKVETIKCKQCSYKNKKDTTYCLKCGHELKSKKQESINIKPSYQTDDEAERKNIISLDFDNLSDAIVLKEILDRPLALRKNNN